MATDTNNNPGAVAQLIVFDFSARKLNFARVSHRIALDALDAGVNAEEIIEIFVDRIDEGDIDRLFDDVVAGGMKFDAIEVTIDVTNISNLDNLIDKAKVVRSAFWWACMAHLRISV